MYVFPIRCSIPSCSCMTHLTHYFTQIVLLVLQPVFLLLFSLLKSTARCISYISCIAIVTSLVYLSFSIPIPVFASSSKLQNDIDLAQFENSSSMIPTAAVYYVSKRGSNQGGTSWQSAWNELNQIDWSVVDPGDTILIDGGSLEMTYTTSMDIDASGTSEAPIRIQAANESERNGKITLFGGRVNALPHCYQDSYDNQTEGIINFGIRTNDHSWLIIDGLDWRGITIHGFHESGIRIDRYSNNVTVRNVEIYNNGYAKNTSRGWFPEGVGIRLSGPNMVVERAIIHDNGQDAIQSMWYENRIADFLISESWLYNGRRHLTVDESWNYCTHTDGLQIYDGGLISGITVENSVVGPGFTNGLILGQTRTDNNAQADVHNVTLRNTLLTKAADNGLFGYEGSNSRGWTLEHVTMHCPKTKWHCITLDNPDHAVTNSIIVGSRLTFEDGLNHHSDNCIWQTSGLELGRNADPRFNNVSESDHFSLDDYSLASDSPCLGKGSSITSVSKLLSMVDSENPGSNDSSGSAVLPPPENPGNPDPGNPDPGNPDPGNPNPGNPDPGNPDPDNPMPGNPDPGSPDPGSPDPGNPTPTDPNPTEPGDDPSSPGIQLGALLNADNMSAVDGQIAYGFETENGAIYQPTDVPLPSQGGLATYRFQLAQSGFYQLVAFVKAESHAHNSVFLNIDSEPVNDFMIWDIDITLGFQSRTVAWRGNGSFEQSEFAPKLFYLDAGEHVLYVRGREANVFLEQFSVQMTENNVVPPIIRPPVVVNPAVYLPLLAGE